jgi:hypothetical protein
MVMTEGLALALGWLVFIGLLGFLVLTLLNGRR